MNPHLQRLRYEDISDVADRIVAEAGYSDTFPRPVLEWAEVDLRIRVIPEAGLKRNFGIEGFIGAGLDTLTIDQDTYFEDRLQKRCRFTVAHELAHYFMHNGLYREADFSNAGEYLEFRGRITDEDMDWFEWQGFAFAGLVLVPRWRLRSLFNERMRAMGDRPETPVDPGVSESLPAFILDACEYFGVSQQTLLKRLVKDEIIIVPN